MSSGIQWGTVPKVELTLTCLHGCLVDLRDAIALTQTSAATWALVEQLTRVEHEVSELWKAAAEREDQQDTAEYRASLATGVSA